MSKINNTETMALNIFKKRHSVVYHRMKTKRSVMSCPRTVLLANLTFYTYLFCQEGKCDRKERYLAFILYSTP